MNSTSSCARARSRTTSHGSRSGTPRDKVIYSDDHSLIGRTLTPSDDLEHALEGRPDDATVVTPSPYSETASEVGLGQLVEVYVPLRFGSAGRPAGAFEIYLSYGPIAEALEQRQTHDRAAGGRRARPALGAAVPDRRKGLAEAAAPVAGELSPRAPRPAHGAAEPHAVHRSASMRRCAREPHDRGAAAVLLIDLDGFREINDTLGHADRRPRAREVGRRLRAELPGEALVARLGGDEYAVLCPHTRWRPDALATAAAIQSNLEAADRARRRGAQRRGEHRRRRDERARRRPRYAAAARRHGARACEIAPQPGRGVLAGVRRLRCQRG